MTYELLIQHGGNIMLPPTVEGVTIEWERQGQPGKLVADIVKTPGLSFQEGDPCRFSVDGTPVFYGFVFDKARKGSNPNVITITVYDQLYYLKNKLFYKLFKSITVDNGCEFQDFEGIELAHRRKGKRTIVFFCHPYSAYERGSNENMNRLIRRFFPKGTSFDNVSEEQLAEAERWVNNYPRKLLGWKSAAMLFEEELQAA